MPTKDATPVRLRIICLHPPAGSSHEPQAYFGLQDKTPALLSGEQRRDGSLQFECQLEAKRTDDTPNFLGAYAHGTPKERFLYLSFGYLQGDQWTWIRRIKIQLSGIMWAQIEAADAHQGVLEATVEGSRAGSVWLTSEQWALR